MSDRGILYFLTNEAMPGLVKIGYTTGDLNDRLQQLNTTGTPSPFLIAAIFYVQDSAQCEKEVHSKLERYRANPKREFFSHSAPHLISESIDIIGKYIDSSPCSYKHGQESETFLPDEDDIYFMSFLLHDAYEQNQPLSTTELAEHHMKYAPLELEVKLINLQNHDFIKRVNREHEGLGLWQILPKGVKFMFDGNHHDQDLIKETRDHA